jgi:Xaa-Pro aminopeptidase
MSAGDPRAGDPRPHRQAPLPPHLAAIVAQPYPRFSDAEFARRRGLLREAMAHAGVDTLLVCGENRAGPAVGWLTGWPTTAEAVVVFDGTRQDVLFIQYHNHVPLGARIARDADVRWGGPQTVDSVADELRKRGARRVGVMGPLATSKQKDLAAGVELVDMGAAYAGLRLVKSAEEVDWARIGAWLSDRAVHSLLDEVRPGITERDLWRICENAYQGEGGTTWIHYFGTTPMADPSIYVPCQYPSTRRLEAGDVVFTEISASFWEYPGQVLRTFTVAADPTPLYRDLYATAEAALAAVLSEVKAGASMQALVDAARCVEEAGFTTCDDLVHGFVGGYLAPVLGSRSRPAGPLPDMTLQAGMMVVVQPNVVTTDYRAGVQVGELVLVTPGGCERLHAAPAGFIRIG